VGSRTRIGLRAPSSRASGESKLRLVLKRTSSPLYSRTSAANALSPAVDVRGHGSAAMDAPSAGADHTGAFIF